MASAPRFRVAALAAAALGGCGGPVRDFVQLRAEAVCGWEARCDRLGVFADEAACVAALVDASSSLGLDDNSCTAFDADAAQACVDAYTAASCEEPVDNAACGQVCGE